MKKFTALSFVFLFAFGLTVGITMTTYEEAQALNKCNYGCEGYTECSDDTGLQCTHPLRPYYEYFVPTCSGGPLGCPGTPYWIGCCPESIVFP